MTNLILAKQNIDDWIQIIVLILVFGASAFSAIGKKLIAYFAERQARRSVGSHTPSSSLPGKPAQARPVSRSAFPVAKAMPGAPPASRRPTPPAARRVPIKQVVPGEAAGSPRPTRPAPPRRSTEPSPPRRARAERPTTGARRSRPASRVTAHVEKHMSTERSRLVNEGAVVAATVDQHVGGLRRRMASADAAVDRSRVATPFGALTVSDLRKAIVLNEILSPPLALREDPMNW